MWDDKRYYSLNYYLKKRFGEKVYKISLNGGMTCPNRDGKIDTRGCIFCSEGGSGDFAESPMLSITGQIESGKDLIKNKTSGNKFIAYFQAFTNTYAPIEYLTKIYTEAINHPDIVALSIATRPDCIDSEVLSLLDRLNKVKPVWVELGFQTSNESTAELIRRGYSNECFKNAVNELHKINVEIVVHLILGLPDETREDMINSVKYISKLPIDGVKLQLLHVLKNTDLADYYYGEGFHIFELEEYVDMLIDCIEILPTDIVIHRITGDGPKKLLIAPLWSGNKKLVLNRINQQFIKRDTYQGKYFSV